MRIRVLHHDGSIQLITPQVDRIKENLFTGDCKGLVETVCRKAFPSTNPNDMRGGKLYVKYEVL